MIRTATHNEIIRAGLSHDGGMYQSPHTLAYYSADEFSVHDSITDQDGNRLTDGLWLVLESENPLSERLRVRIA